MIQSLWTEAAFLTFHAINLCVPYINGNIAAINNHSYAESD